MRQLGTDCELVRDFEARTTALICVWIGHALGTGYELGMGYELRRTGLRMRGGRTAAAMLWPR